MIPFAHFSVGAAIGLLLCFLFVKDIEIRLLLSFPVVMVAGAIAMAPDVGHFIPLFSSIETRAIGNLFFFHTYMDSINTGGVLFEVMFSILLQMHIFLTIIENRVRVIKRRRQKSYIARASR